MFSGSLIKQQLCGIRPRPSLDLDVTEQRPDISVLGLIIVTDYCHVS